MPGKTNHLGARMNRRLTTLMILATTISTATSAYSGPAPMGSGNFENLPNAGPQTMRVQPNLVSESQLDRQPTPGALKRAEKQAQGRFEKTLAQTDLGRSHRMYAGPGGCQEYVHFILIELGASLPSIPYAPCNVWLRTIRERRPLSCGLRRSNASRANRIWPTWRQRIASYRLSRSSAKLGKLARRKKQRARSAAGSTGSGTELGTESVSVVMPCGA